MHERLTEHEQALIIERRRERWGTWPRLIEQAARLDVVIEQLVEREEAQPCPDPDRLERVWSLQERVLARLHRRQRNGPPEQLWGLPGEYNEAGERPATTHGDGWRPIQALDDEERGLLAGWRREGR